MPSADHLPGTWTCNGTSSWYFLDHRSGTPARCSREPGMVECATRGDGRGCQWGRLFEKPAPYQPLQGVLTGAAYAVPCGSWPPKDGSDECVHLGCYSGHAAHHCEPEALLPAIEARTVCRTTARIVSGIGRPEPDCHVAPWFGAGLVYVCLPRPDRAIHGVG